ncbi:hypothetical protein OS965_23700 [Streptomyces sp. H27-G5]|uniref:hypothetical protein n=1 Tax=Streptomyces sp. H27-G5 TaxID=2996698 RepID=UPI0022705CBE|nr:hypothetical protein [Streptomyces sp. H27-G5]MCY0921155.1 hypothetical protein [Streptomyces sp. H27-G5]
MAEAKHAFDAYKRGDRRPMQNFIASKLRLYDRLDDRCQAVALALLEVDWSTAVDLSDEKQVRSILSWAARNGCDLEGDHQVRKQRIGYIGDIEITASVPGPEDLVIDRTVPWHENFENPHVLSTVARLNLQDRVIARTWAENPPIAWPQASIRAGADPNAGDSVRRKIKRYGAESIRREQAPRA